MALSANTVWEVRTGGSNSANGGGFNHGNTNFATDLVATGGTGTAPVVSSASYVFTANDVGAYLFVKSGTNWNPGWYQIVSIVGGAATLDASVGAVAVYRSAIRYYLGGQTEINTTAGVATVASPTAGTWGIDYSQQDAARIAFTDIVIGATTTQFTSAANPVGKNFIGNILQVTGGTGFTVGFYEVVSTSGTTATCDRSLGTASSTGGTGGLGGALATLAAVAAVAVTSNVCWLKTGTYNTATQIDTGATWGGYGISGYDTVRGDSGIATIRATAAITVISFRNTSGNYNVVRNLDFDGNSATGTIGLMWGTSFVTFTAVFENVSAHNFSSHGFSPNSGFGSSCTFVRCRSYSNGGAGFVGYANNGDAFYFCVAHNNTSHGFGNGFTNGTGYSYHGCLSYSNGGSGFGHTGAALFANCVAYGNTATGFIETGFTVKKTRFFNCIAYGNGAYGWDAANLTNVTCTDCAAGANTSGTASTTFGGFVGPTNITLTADPFTNPATGNFSLNNTAGGGASCRAAGFPGVMPGGLTTGYQDIGAAQHQDTGGGGGGVSGARIFGGF